MDNVRPAGVSMLSLISFEGCLGAGKTTLTNYFGRRLSAPHLLEAYQKNPFLADFYESKSKQSDRDIFLETELSFLLIHYSQLKDFARELDGGPAFSDFHIEKDLVYARLNLGPDDLAAFEAIYDHLTSTLPTVSHVVYLDASPEVIQRRIFQRGRPYELNSDPQYIKDYADKVKAYFVDESPTPTAVFNVDELVLEEGDESLAKIEEHLRKIGVAGV